MSDVRVRDAGLVRWITLDRPEKRNALDGAMVGELGAALADARASSARAIALEGAGTVFSAGADLRALQRIAAASHDENVADARRLADLFLAIAEHPLPVIAAVHGPAVAGGAGLVAACDHAIAAEEATFAFTEVRIGFVPAIVLQFLVRRVGERAARDLCLTARTIDAAEALALGLVDARVPKDALAERVAERAALYARASPSGIATTKRLFVDVVGLPLRDALRAAVEENARARATEECREGVASFLEKRAPRWAPRP